MARIAVVAGPDPGHALPALGVAASLRTRGHDVRFLSGAGHEATATAHDLVVEMLPRLAPTVGDDDLGHRLWVRAAEMAVPLAEHLRPWHADLVVADTLTRCGAFAAQLLDVPWIELVPHHLDDPADDLPPVGLGRRPARSALRRRDDRRIVRLQRRSLGLGAAQARAVAGTIGLAEVAHPVIRLIGTFPSLERRRAFWPEDAHVVGPLALDPVLPPLEPPAGELPLVVVTDSTASGVERGLGEVALRALARLDLRLVVTSDRLAARRETGVVVGRGPHGPLMQAASLAVGFGGAGFVGKALVAGVPLVVVPLQGDQREGAARLRDAGVGRSLPLRALRPSRLRWAVLRQLDDQAARASAAVLAGEGRTLGPRTAAGLVEQVLEGRVPVASGPTEHLPEGDRGSGRDPTTSAPIGPL